MAAYLLEIATGKLQGLAACSFALTSPGNIPQGVPSKYAAMIRKSCRQRTLARRVSQTKMAESEVAVPRSMPSGWNSAAVYPALTASSDTCTHPRIYQSRACTGS